MPSLTSNTIALHWSASFPLSDAYLSTEKCAGLYLWGFNDGRNDINWYVGQSTRIYVRLRQHYLYIMSGQYQLPKHYLPGAPLTPGCIPQSSWAIGGHHASTAKLIKNWIDMQKIFHAGHRFAHEAFARTAILPNASKAALGSAEKAAIADLEPLINKRDTKSSLPVNHQEDLADLGWVQSWKHIRNCYN